MKDFVILADSTCDLSEDILGYFGVCDYIKAHAYFSDGRDYAVDLNWSSISREEFYKTLSESNIQVTTSPASLGEYLDAFRSYAEKGYDILSMSLSSKISSTYQIASKAAQEIQEEFPDCRIYCLDSYRMSSAFGLIAIYAYNMKNEGKTFDEIVEAIEEMKYRVHLMGPIDDLMFVAKRGRISKGKAIFGSFAGVKPMGDCNPDGYVTVVSKVKGVPKALAATVEYVKRMAIDIEDQFVVVSHSNREEYANTLKTMIEDTLHPKKVFITDSFMGSGANIGPGMIGAYFLGNKVSEDMSVEKETMGAILGK